MKRYHSVLCCVAVLFATSLVGVGAQEASGEDRGRESVHLFDPDAYDDQWLKSDRNSDGVVDYAVEVDERGYKIREAMDFNYDGLMDDFYFYANDVLQREELDSNFDGRIDIWVYLHRGVYIRRWERDRDYDGVIDSVKDYEQPVQQ